MVFEIEILYKYIYSMNILNASIDFHWIKIKSSLFVSDILSFPI